jgi:RHS repeat-associated protein
VSGNIVTVTASTTGAASNYAVSVSYTKLLSLSNRDFTATLSSSTLTGGADGDTTYDAGTISATINGVTSTAAWSQGSTASSLATALAAAINSASGSSLTAIASGTSVSLKSNNTGSATNWSISTLASDMLSSKFSSASFTVSSSGMSGGADAGTSTGTLYSYSIPSSGGYATNGNLLSFTDSVIGSWNFNVTDSNGNAGYDPLNRLTAGYASSGLYAGQYTCWTYDAFGNRLTEAISSTACNASPISTSWALYNGTINGTANNQMSSMSTNVAQGTDGYDVAGNVTYDGNNIYVYDIQGRLCAVQTGGNGGSVTGYLYNADGQRVAKGAMSSLSCPTTAASFSLVISQYLLGQGGEQVTELDGTGAWVHTNVWAGGRLLSTYQGSELYYALTDWLGTKRVELGAASKCTAKYSSMPFGNDLAQVSGTCTDATEHHFTGKERDAESGNDYFGARYYASTMGRFMSPDWSAKAEPVPYAKTDNPQSLNLYAYVLNNPLRNIDADGHEGGDGQNGGGSLNGVFCLDPENDGCGWYDRIESDLQKNSDILIAKGAYLRVKHAPDDPDYSVIVSAGDGSCDLKNPLCQMSFELYLRALKLQRQVAANKVETKYSSSVLNSRSKNLKNWAVRHFCGNDPTQNIEMNMLKYGFKGFWAGVIAGGTEGATVGSVFEGVGAVPGAIMGGVAGGVTGTGAGVIRGGAFSGACAAFGVYD